LSHILAILNLTTLLYIIQLLHTEVDTWVHPAVDIGLPTADWGTDWSRHWGTDYRAVTTNTTNSL